MNALDASFDVGHGAGVGRPQGRHDLAMLAHDVRGALSGVIGGMAEIETLELPPGLREQIERVAAAARSLAGLTALMLGETPDPAAAPGGEPLRLPAFLAHLRRRWAGEAQRKGLRFDIAAEADLPALRMDDLPLARALDNLISNAIKHCDAGGVRLSAAREPGGGVAFRVSDDGPGIAEEALARLPGDAPAADANGHGLGLRIVRRVAEAHGGAFDIANRAPRGAEATLRFPEPLCVAPAPAAPSDPEEERRSPPALAGLRVLLAEDNPTNQMVAAQMLRSLDAEVSICSDGVEALERFEQAPFDVVVVDIEMPRLSGLDVIRAIRARGDDRAGVPIVALTAYALREHRDRVLEAGANGLISKPITSIEAFGRDLAVHVGAPAPRPPAPTAPASDPADAGPVVDDAIYGALVETIGHEMMAELLDKVVADLCDARDGLAGAVATLDRGPIRSASHILISVAGALGATRLQSCARMLNTAAHGAADDGIADEARRCVDEIDAAVDFIRARRVAG